ncbi:mitochondrial glycine transporter Ymc1p [Trichomonascus vanleenenianus]|uniref:mitochondrial glycine transporter Ymc1p n=1 Tax=Trichomonascus vanleenenianus TaxID=2268995 RepID=UPI003EC9E2FA
MSEKGQDNSVSRKAKDIAAGFFGGAVQVLVGQPFDLVKVRIQAGQYKTPVEALTQTLKNEGVFAFYKGTAAPLIGVGACVSVQFYAFLEAKRQILQAFKQQQLTFPQIYLCGAVAGIANTVVSSPVEQLRIILQTQKDGRYKGPIDAAKQVFRSHGLFRGLYRGFNVTLLREAQAYGVWFLTYEYLMSLEKRPRDDVPAWKLMVYGALAGEALWLASYPLDVIKSKVQSDSFERPQYTSARDALRKTWTTSGMPGFWRGLAPTLLRAIPASASTFASVELALRVLE